MASHDGVAKGSGRDGEWTVDEAPFVYVEREGDGVLCDARGIAELDSGDDHDFDDVIQEAWQVILDGGRETAR